MSPEERAEIEDLAQRTVEQGGTCGATLDGYGRTLVCDDHVGGTHGDSTAQVRWLA